MQKNRLELETYKYDLPEEKIAKYPLPDRAKSKLLVYQNGAIDHKIFHQIDQSLPPNSHLVFNNTKVIPARIVLHKETGARIEIFLLDPIQPSGIYEEVMAAKGNCSWHVMIGNAKKWKVGTVLNFEGPGSKMEAIRADDTTVRFQWNGDYSFSEILSEAGKIPLPPYLGREAEEQDIPRYQTVYSKSEGAVAAPTAGLHFTKEILSRLETKGFTEDYLTLHVSAGTFQPIKAKNLEDHPMHREQIVIRKENIEQLMDKDTIIPVGTTSMRTLESLYWFGNKLHQQPDAPFTIEKLEPYQGKGIPRNQALENILKYMDQRKTQTIIGHTEIFIFPGYKFRICNGLITNFHLPGSTLILLVAALIGEDWHRVYQEALNNDYRFLSYGDSSLLLPKSY